jgi:hypothetical protein
MQWMILVLLASDPLPKELAYQLDQIRLLPTPVSGGMMVDMARGSQLSAAQRRALAEEAFEIAAQAPQRELMVYSGGGPRLSIDPQRGVDQLWWANPQAVAAAAYVLYQTNSGAALVAPERKMSVNFPERGVRKRSSCETYLVSDPKGYFEAARQLGAKQFRSSLGSISSSVELGRALEALPQATVAERDGYVGFVHDILLSLNDSDRDFSYAMQKTGLHRGVLSLAAGGRGRILANYRAFLLRHFEGERCPDQADEVWSGVIREFNQAVLGMGPGLRLPEGAGLARRLAAKSKEEFLFEGAIAGALWLDAGNLSGEDTAFTNFMRRMEEWKTEVYTGAAGGIAKVVLYRRALDKLARHAFAARVLASYSKFLEADSLRRELPAYWLAGVEAVAVWAGQSPARRNTLETSGSADVQIYFKAKGYLEGLKGTR